MVHLDRQGGCSAKSLDNRDTIRGARPIPLDGEQSVERNRLIVEHKPCLPRLKKISLLQSERDFECACAASQIKVQGLHGILRQ